MRDSISDSASTACGGGHPTVKDAAKWAANWAEYGKRVAAAYPAPMPLRPLAADAVWRSSARSATALRRRDLKRP